MDHHADFALQSLLFVSSLVAEGDYETLLRIGIRGDQLEKILALNIQEIHEIASISKASFIDISFDSNFLDTAIDLCDQRIKQRNQIYQMLKAGASLPAMNQLFGLTSADLANLRKFLNLPKVNGRPMLPSEADQARIWEIWKNTLTENLSIAERLLLIHQQTHVKINAIWPLVQDWFDFNSRRNT